ncbi:hypothetical protein EV356DRAFT_273879 [Viridothelium virens]|uniref:Uncharacterized protein n=1 Tax=Viridothelium virens TaxID=1048519 RepID=A0A6A6H1S8_VIRVR|nr:hypothetical protein EV356DRAFT_273879 [Viridothelium virens]
MHVAAAVISDSSPVLSLRRHRCYPASPHSSSTSTSASHQAPSVPSSTDTPLPLKLSNPPCRLQPVHHWHADIHEHDVRWRHAAQSPLELCHGRPAVSRDGHDGAVVSAGQRGLEEAEVDGVVVDEKEALGTREWRWWGWGGAGWCV